MFINSQSAAAQAIDCIINHVWEQVAVKNIQRMVPDNVKLMNTYTFQSIAQLHSQYLQKQDGVNCDSEKNCIGRDNLLISFVNIEKGKRSLKTQVNQFPNPSLLSQIKSKRSNQPKFKTQSSQQNSANPSKNQSKQTSQRNKQDKISSKFITLNPNQNEGDLRTTNRSKNKILQSNRDIEMIRERRLMSEQMRNDQEKQFKLNQLKKQQRKQALAKKQKQMQKFTYDYNGDFFNSKLSNPETTLGAAAKIRSQFHKQLPKPLKKQRIKPLFYASIVNQKLEERHRRLATQQMENELNKQFFKQNLVTVFASSFSNDEHVSEGVSIKELSSNFCRAKPVSKIGFNKVTLSQYKDKTKNSRFKQYNIKPPKNLQSLPNPNPNPTYLSKPSNHKSQQNFFNRNPDPNANPTESLQALQIEQQRSQQIQPAAKNSIRFKAMFRSEQSSILSKSGVSGQGSGGAGYRCEAGNRGVIRVSNQRLFKEVFPI